MRFKDPVQLNEGDQNTRRNRRALIALATVVSLSACEVEPAPVAETPVRVDAAVAAFVDGHPIYAVDVQMEAAAQGMVAASEELDFNSPEFNQVLDQLIDQHLLAREAEARNLDEDPSASHRLQAARERILGNVLVETLVAENVDEAAIRKMYEAQIGLIQLGEEVHMRHIVLETRDAAEQVIRELSEGVDFAVLASNISIDDTTRLEGGDLGYVKPEDAPAELVRVIETTPMGGIANPFETDLGWHVVKVEDRRTEQPPTMEELRPQIMRFLTLGEIDQTLKRLRARARIDNLNDGAGAAVDDPFDSVPEEPDAGPNDPT
ncbi:MAG: peptidylprolyl isomerase [Pseudomonadota bacterium]